MELRNDGMGKISVLRDEDVPVVKKKGAMIEDMAMNKGSGGCARWDRASATLFSLLDCSDQYRCGTCGLTSIFAIS
ncbi:hypothetical protein Scep_021925 [Stephania cephalantha]|uniref:Uncharacterized protein n=1 Tax=Stephania cephalantha TaxID=152367 RepID=A0AAP0F4D1_9MAGN